MSADNPADGTADKPIPVPPAPAETNDSADAYDPDLDELAGEALSEPPISYDEDPPGRPCPPLSLGPDRGTGDGADGGGAAPARRAPSAERPKSRIPHQPNAPSVLPSPPSPRNPSPKKPARPEATRTSSPPPGQALPSTETTRPTG